MEKFATWFFEVEQQMMLPDARQFAYLGCILEKNSQKHLLGIARKLYSEHTGSVIPKDWEYRAHHMTVKFKPQISDMQLYQNLFGQPVELHIKGIAIDEFTIAAVIGTNINMNSTPHITIAHSRSVSPVYSNGLVRSGKVLKVEGEVSLSSIFLAVKFDQTKVWPQTTINLASLSLV